MTDSTRATGIRIAGNTYLPALLTLRAKGYRIWLEYTKLEDTASSQAEYMLDYQAEGNGGYFSATTPVELLGLVAIYETRGANWKWQPGEPDLDDELHKAARTFDRDGNEIKDD